jgi:AcrR family transcriptional regulator
MSSFAEKHKQLKEQAAQEAIYEATLKVVSRQQGDSLKMQDIAETAGIATGTLYNYFKNKVELLTFVDDRLHEVILEKLESVVASDLEPVEKLRAFVQEIFAFCDEHHIVFDLAEKFGVRDKIPKDKKQKDIGHARNCIARIITEGIAGGQFRAVEASMMARHFFSTMIGVIEIKSWLRDTGLIEQTDELVDFFLSYLTVRPS